eukprot:NODE_91_length_21557_cov_0.766660.p6 type:complete len:360 gc:universal NODE_91_length_21557_cov_0.766660:8895-7816(-)
MISRCGNLISSLFLQLLGFRKMWFVLFGAILSVTIQTEMAGYLQGFYNKPTFIVYCVHGSFVLVLLSEYIQFLIRKGHSLSFKLITSKAHIYSYIQECLDYMSDRSFSQILWTSAWLVTLYNLCTYFWYLAIVHTTTNELTAIFNSGTCFAYIFSILLIGEKSMLRKWFGVLLSMSGVCIIALVGYESEESHLYGNFLGLIGAILYGLYENLYYLNAVNPSKPSSQFSFFFTGLMGISSFFTFWIPIAINSATGEEIFEFPTLYEFSILSIVVFTGVLFDTLFFQLISMTSPTIAAAGCLLSIPSVLLCDIALQKSNLSWNMIIGSIVLCLGFYILHLEEFQTNTDYEPVELETVHKDP